MGTPHDLVKVAKNIVYNPSMKTRVFNSRALNPFRRGAKAPLSTAGTAASKALGLAASFIPIPPLKCLVQGAFAYATKKIRSLSHQHKLSVSPPPEEQVKFELKEIGNTVANWDRYRWKVQQAIQDLNDKTGSLSKPTTDGVCEQWVAYFEKIIYARKRVQKLRDSLIAVEAIHEMTREWLAEVDNALSSQENRVVSKYRSIENAMARDASAHDNCSSGCCMLSPTTVAPDVPDSPNGIFKHVGHAAAGLMDTAMGASSLGAKGGAVSAAK